MEVIVMIDGNVTTDKLNTWLSRRAERMDALRELNERLKRNGSICESVFVDSSNWFAPNGSYFYIGQVFASIHHCRVIYAQTDCDREMVGYASVLGDQCYAIAGNDSDFFIFDVPLYIQLRSLHFSYRAKCLDFVGCYHRDFLSAVEL
ncbi:hypothetical protein RFI_02542 [Reticulomyxa filosa]|uniref:Uncharacterized protein n=1 Tax=Reticulomyxa filosa TaxID=46433 RepID=X6P8M2_RETFI|nr:hypothetical protein RFI_02542 [Reticulomyxa filosa]|eukprot:ETO34551.1 hypothetical protein RFI_02542 [Reticulomyxa filosa]